MKVLHDDCRRGCERFARGSAGEHPTEIDRGSTTDNDATQSHFTKVNKVKLSLGRHAPWGPHARVSASAAEPPFSREPLNLCVRPPKLTASQGNDGSR